MEINVNDDNFEAEVKQSDIPVLVDFYADWCGPCKMLSPTVSKIAAEYEGKIKVAKVNVDLASETASSYGIISIPTVMFFRGGEKVDQFVGLVSPSEVKKRVENVLA
jgi:thioredoxin 1